MLCYAMFCYVMLCFVTFQYFQYQSLEYYKYATGVESKEAGVVKIPLVLGDLKEIKVCGMKTVLLARLMDAIDA